MAVATVAAVGACAFAAGSALTGGDDTATEAKAPPAPPPPQLPGGGRRLFPDKRIVAFYGAPQDDALGALGIGTPAQAGRRLLKAAAPYERETRPVLPAMELIATIANRDPGDDGLYITRQSPATIDRYLRCGPPHPRAARPRHPARPRRLPLRDAATGEVAARARRRAGAGPRVARRRGAGPGSGHRVGRRERRRRGRRRAVEDRAAGSAAGEAAAGPPVHGGHDRQQGGADAPSRCRAHDQRRRLRRPREQGLEVRDVHRRAGPLQRRLQAVLRGGHEPHAPAGVLALRPPPDVVVYE